MTPPHFLTELDQLLAQMDWPEWASATGNRASPPADPADIAALAAAFPLPDQLREFFQHCGCLYLVDVWNGYRIHEPSNILGGARHGMPLKVRALDPVASGPILCFGSDGGGSSFAIRTDHRGEVLFLGASEVTESVWIESGNPKIRLLAPDFHTFLDLLLQDVRAFVTGKPGWSYMTGWEWKPNNSSEALANRANMVSCSLVYRPDRVPFGRR